MSKKDNLNQAMYEMFGVGKGSNSTTAKEVKETKEEELASQIQPIKVAGVEVVSSQEINRSSGFPTKPATTYIAPGTQLEGILKSKGDVEVAGEFKGDIFSEGKVILHSSMTGNISSAGLNILDCRLNGDVQVTGNVTLNESSSVVGNIRCADLTCAGKVNGDMEIRGNMSLSERAQVQGNVRVGTLTIARGARLCGSVEMQETTVVQSHIEPMVYHTKTEDAPASEEDK